MDYKYYYRREIKYNKNTKRVVFKYTNCKKCKLNYHLSPKNTYNKLIYYFQVFFFIYLIVKVNPIVSFRFHDNIDVYLIDDKVFVQ